MPEKPPFLGTGWGFPPTFHLDRRGVGMVSDEEDIAQSLWILLNTQLGERVMRPDYGADLKSQLFEPMNASLVTFIGDIVETAIIYYEPRIKLDDVSLTPRQEEGRLDVSLDYTIRSTNTRYNYVFPFYITEGSSLS